jgi:hypothetical protein
VFRIVASVIGLVLRFERRGDRVLVVLRHVGDRHLEIRLGRVAQRNTVERNEPPPRARRRRLLAQDVVDDRLHVGVRDVLFAQQADLLTHAAPELGDRRLLVLALLRRVRRKVKLRERVVDDLLLGAELREAGPFAAVLLSNRELNFGDLFELRVGELRAVAEQVLLREVVR